MTVARTKKKLESSPPTVPAVPVAPVLPSTLPPNGTPNEVLTLAEAAAYLRVPEKDVIAAVSTQALPGRVLNGEWRFSRTGIQQWLCVSQPPPQRRNAAMIAMAGAWKDDPYLEDMVEEIYRKRGRPITEDGSYRLSHGLKPEDVQK
jgi:hypothetical protein